jgi:hypothetical protein
MLARDFREHLFFLGTSVNKGKKGRVLVETLSFFSTATKKRLPTE